MRYLSLFSGIGSPEQALKNLGVSFELVGFSEIDKFAIKSYCEIHETNESLNLGDITKINIENLPVGIDLITHGSPCFPAGTKVMTDRGFKEIQNIELGDKVLTHTNEFKEVYEVMKNKSNDIYEIKTQCSFKFKATGNHPFYVRKKIMKFDSERRVYKRIFEKPEWKWLKNINKDYFVGVAINKNSKYPIWNGVENNQNNNVMRINNLKNLFNKKEFWYLVGRFIGDGWITEGYNKREKKPTYRVTICCGHDEVDEFESRLNGILKYTIVKERTVYKFQFSNKELTLFLKQFGKGAKNKQLTNTIFDLPVEELKSFLDGYLESDGYLNKNNKYKISSISEELILGVGQIVAKVYNNPFSISKTKRPKTYIIEGRKVNQNDTYEISFFKELKKTHGFYEDGIIWMPIREVKKVESENIDVYNLEVRENHSYTVNNIIVHNCQDFSIAGKGMGGNKDSGTRSSLMWNTVAICEHCKPRYVIWENVKNVLSKRHKHNFDKYIDEMNRLGYNNYYKVLNAKDYGVPQNRERVFIVSIRKDIKKEFNFPKPFDNGIRLKDILEEEVEEKYYINTDAAYNLQPNSATRRGRVGKQVVNTLNTSCNQAVVVEEKEVVRTPLKFLNRNGRKEDGDYSFCVDSCNTGGIKEIYKEEIRIRKLTPKECWRLMGFKDEQFNKAKRVNSNSQLYKQAGNSIVVDVMEEIFKNLF